MSLRGTISRPDKGPLGSVDEVQRQLTDAFPGVRFTLQPDEPPGLAAARKQMGLLLRAWLALFGESERYPHWTGAYEPGRGAVEFYFEASEPVRWIRATSYGMTAGLDDNFDRLSAATGWVVKYPRV